MWGAEDKRTLGALWGLSAGRTTPARRTWLCGGPRVPGPVEDQGVPGCGWRWLVYVLVSGGRCGVLRAWQSPLTASVVWAGVPELVAWACVGNEEVKTWWASSVPRVTCCGSQPQPHASRSGLDEGAVHLGFRSVLAGVPEQAVTDRDVWPQIQLAAETGGDAGPCRGQLWGTGQGQSVRPRCRGAR